MIRVKIKLDTSRIDRLETRLLKNADKQLLKFCEAIIKDVNESWYKGAGAVSLRGGPPKTQSGRLKDSIKIDKASRNRDEGGRFVSGDSSRFYTIHVGAPYAGRLEYGNLDRPFLEPAVERQEGQFPIYMERIARE